MTDIVTVAPILLAAASFALSIYTLWVTQLRRGQLKMTRPTLVCLRRVTIKGHFLSPGGGRYTGGVPRGRAGE
jgi:hypothetical protein